MSKPEARNDLGTSSRQIAVALGYRPERDEARRVLASGEGRVAETMLELALAHGVPVREDADLATILRAFEPGEEVSEDLYRAIAEVLAFIYRQSKVNRIPGGGRDIPGIGRRLIHELEAEPGR